MKVNYLVKVGSGSLLAKFCLLALFIFTGVTQVVAQSQADAGLSPFEARYKAYRNGSELGFAEMRLTKLPEENRYQLFYKSEVSMFFLSDERAETSEFNLDGSNIVPQTYQYVRTGTGRDKKLDLVFDAEKQKIVINGKNNDPINWQGEWDNQLYRFDLQRQLAQGETSAQYKLLNYRGQMKQYGFEVLGEETLDLPYGKIKAIKVKTIRENKKRETFSWFAPDLDYVLVRLQQFKKGKEQGDIRLSRYTIQEPAESTEAAN